MKILAIDDNRDNLTSLKAVVADRLPDAIVLTALDGTMGLELAQTEDPDVILLDIVMPGMDGFEVCRKLKEDERLQTIPVLFLTALRTEQDSRIKALEVGAEGFVSKPFHEIELIAQVRAMAKIKTANRLLRMEKEQLAALVAERTRELERELAERQRAEEALHESRTMLRYVLDSVPQSVFWKDLNSVFLGCNRVFSDSVGLESPDDIIGKTDFELSYPREYAEAYRADDQEVMSNNRPKLHIIEPLQGTDGKRIWVDTSKAPLHDEQGNVYGVLGVYEDITERRQMEEERDRLITAIEQAAEIIFITDPDGTIQYANPAFDRVTGYARDEIIGQNPRILKSGQQNEAFYRAMWETISGGSAWEGRFVNKCKDGTLYTEEATISPVYDASGRLVNYVAVKRDITHDLDLEQQIRQSQKMEAIGQLAGGVAHDFNNILQAMMGYGGMLLDRLPEGEELHEFATEIANGTERAAALTRQLLMFSRRQVMQPVNLDLNEVIEDLMKMLRRIIGEDIRLEWLPGNRLGAIHADTGMMEQVLMNLCVNARDAMPQGGALTIETQNALIDAEYCANYKWAIPGRYVMLSVADTGCGMDKATIEHIFEPFFTTKELGKGTGLGLATVYGIVKQHQGMIQVYSEPGEGTTFKVYLPLCEHNADAVDSISKEPVVGGDETILLAEDDEKLREVAVRILNKAGYTVLVAEDGMEAVTLFEENADHVALLLLDVVMPNMGGRDVFEHIRAIRPDIKTLFSSGYSEDAVHTKFVLHEGLRLIQKPYSPGVLLRKIREVLDKD